ncbi:MAG: NAD-binding protein [Blastocatellia bacterium]|nr:NAD-binding protein [Blastocatellia bacterium]
MKFLASQVSYFLNDSQSRQNIGALAKYLAFLGAVVTLYSVMFHFIMGYSEGRYFSWITGFYWTLTVMTTLGFGDITFESDLGRAFSVLVLISGVFLLLVMLPFAFIRYFYAPWLEAQIHAESPRSVPPDVSDHVIICTYDTIAPNLIKRLDHSGIAYYVIEPDPAKSAQLFRKGVSVVNGKIDSRITYERMRAKEARMVFANCEDTANTNITLTVREVAPHVPIAAIAADEDSIDILELSGATHVLPLKQRLGEHLAHRINAGGERTHVIGKLEDWRVIEFTVQDTKLAGKKIRDTRIREKTGVNIIGVWERGRLIPAADPNARLSDFSVPLGVGTVEQIESLEKLLKTDKPASKSVLILGGGKVGRAAAQTLKQENITVYMVEREPLRQENIGAVPDRLTIGDAADRDTLMKGGLMESSIVIVSTNDDAVNIYLSVYCRRLNPNVRIISRITHDRNIEAIHRAGADFVLSYAPLGAESVLSLIQGRDPVVMGEGVEFFTVPVPRALSGKTLRDSRIGEMTGLIVLDIMAAGDTIANPPPEFVFPRNSQMHVLGTAEQLHDFKKFFS